MWWYFPAGVLRQRVAFPLGGAEHRHESIPQVAPAGRRREYRRLVAGGRGNGAGGAGVKLLQWLVNALASVRRGRRRDRAQGAEAEKKNVYPLW
jgi:hypothetical protein